MENKQREKSAAEAYREERKQRMAKAAKKQTKKNPKAAKAGRIVGKVIAIVLAVAICLAAVGGILNFFGVPQKVLKAAKFGSEKDTVATYNYYYMTLYNYYYNMSKIYEDLYLKSSKNINVKNLMPIIKNKRNMLIAIKGIRNVVHMLEMIWSSIGIKL